MGRGWTIVVIIESTGKPLIANWSASTSRRPMFGRVDRAEPRTLPNVRCVTAVDKIEGVVSDVRHQMTDVTSIYGTQSNDEFRWVSRDGWTFFCAAAGVRLRRGALWQCGGAAVGGFSATRGGACPNLDDPALRALSQPAARPRARLCAPIRAASQHSATSRPAIGWSSRVDPI